jgi:hypothetical protein
MAEQQLTPRQRYEALQEKIKSLGFGEHIDPCVDAENVYPYKEVDGDMYWLHMTTAMYDSVTIRLEDIGIDLADYGIKF